MTGNSLIRPERLTARLVNDASDNTRNLRERKAHCFDGACFAALALLALGQPPRLIDMLPWDDDDHVLDRGASGIWHVSNSGQTTWFDFAGAIFEEWGLAPDKLTVTAKHAVVAVPPAILEKPAVRDSITKLGFSLKVRDPAAFRPYHAEEMQTWAEIIKTAGVKQEG